MKKGMTITIVVAVVLVVAIGAYFYFSSPSYNNSNTNTNVNNNPSTNSQTSTQVLPTNSGSSNPATQNIQIMNFAFSPSSLTIHAGDTVVWTNQDSAGHSVVSDSGSEINSPILSTGQTYSHTFTTPGTYSYHCSVHLSMKGTIIVQ
jgi:plastocyanin